MELEEALGQLGFSPVRSSRGTRHYAKRPNPHLTYWVQVRDQGDAVFSWEFAIAEYMATLGLQVGSDEHLNTFLFPQADARGPQDAAWVVEQIDRAEELLGSISLLGPEPGDTPE